MHQWQRAIMIFYSKEPMYETAASVGITIWLRLQLSTLILYGTARRPKWDGRNYCPCIFQVFEGNINISDLSKNGIVLVYYFSTTDQLLLPTMMVLTPWVRVELPLISNCTLYQSYIQSCNSLQSVRHPLRNLRDKHSTKFHFSFDPLNSHSE